MVLFLVLMILGGIGAHRWFVNSSAQGWFAELDPILEKIIAEVPDEDEPRPVVGERVQREVIPQNDIVEKAPSKAMVASREVEMWESFRNTKLTRFVTQLQDLLGVEDPLEVDWGSLGQESDSDERLEYDLEALLRTLSMDKWYEVPGYELDVEQLRRGIERIQLGRVALMEQRRFEVKEGTLELDLYWGPFGSFSPDDIRTLLADRNREQLSHWVNTPATPLSPLMEEARRNRLPRLYRDLEKSLGHTIPLQIDWASLDSSPEAAYRLVYVLDEVIKAITEVASAATGYVGYRRSELEQKRIEEQRIILVDSIQALRVRGGSYRSDPVIRFESNQLKLVIFTDEELSEHPASAPSWDVPLYQMKQLSSCKKRALVRSIKEQLDLDVGPLLRQLKALHFPKTQSYMRKHLDALIGKTRFKVSERMELREMLAARGISLEMDWNSFTTPGDTDEKMRVLGMLETGRYNPDYGDLFKHFFFAIDEVARKDTDSLKSFIALVRKIRFEQVSDPANKELAVDGDTLVVRQCLFKTGGTISYDDLAYKIMVTLGTMRNALQSTPERGGEGIEICLAELGQALGQQVGIMIDDALSAGPRTVENSCERIIRPLVGALRYLQKQPGYSSVMQELIESVRLGDAPSPEQSGFAFSDGRLELRCSLGFGPKGCPAGDKMARAIDDVLALGVRAKIAEIERANRAFWSRMLRERFARDVALDMDWDSFLAHPTAGGVRLYPLDVQEAGIERLIYALTGWMDDDDEFRSEAIKRIRSLHITSADDVNTKQITAEDGRIVYRCFAGDWDGYYTIDELQQQLNRLIPRRGNARKMDADWSGGLIGYGTNVPPLPSDLPAKQMETQPLELGNKTSKIGREGLDSRLRIELESVYRTFLEAVAERDLDRLLEVVKISKHDEETFRKEFSSDGFVSFGDWLLAVYPPLEESTFVSVRSVDDDFAGYYMVSVPAESQCNLNLTLLRFDKSDGRWRMLYQLSGADSAVFLVRKDEEVSGKIKELMETNPLLKLNRPEMVSIPDEWTEEVSLSEGEARLMETLKALYSLQYSALERRDIDGFFSVVIMSPEEKELLRKKIKKLSRELLNHWPEPSRSRFVKLETLGEKLAGYYIVAPYPQNPAFDFLYLMPCVKHNGSWRILFSLEQGLAVSMAIAKSDGNLISRVNEVLDKVDILRLEWVMSSLFEELVPLDDDGPGLSSDYEELNLAIVAMERKDYKTALDLLQPLAEAGEAKAQSLLGLLYAEGNGVKQNHQASFDLFKRSAEQGDADGLYYLGYSYLYGSGVEPDLVRALALFIVAADRGQVRAAKERDKGLAVLDEEERREAADWAESIRGDMP